ncbi:nuclear transcription factor Y subunit C-3 [Prunus yedoensis var. nudiflora]|uniref:Nuclear transcription factor Y subunit C-3 n=1 Tax=Prunus yedoensis var. nudiflora TaxID=2094558 RepID=A0A314UV55_PRUYE|nr:nuclear transcription factor Y subunit C-3 [Prunus yedoensis var. nudiflora]
MSSTDGVPYYYMPAQHAPQVGAPGMIVGKPVMDQTLYGQQTHPYIAQPTWPQQQQPHKDS